MLPRGLTGRIVLAFAALGTATLIALAGSLFVVLRELHQTEITDSLTRQATAIAATLSTTPAGQWETTIQQSGASIADDGGFVILKGPAGAIRVLAGDPVSVTVPSPDEGTPLLVPATGPDGTSGSASPSAGSRTTTGTLQTSDGKQYIYVERVMGTNGARLLLFAVPDRSAALALGDMRRALLIVVAILLVVGIPLAWLLSRSLTGPMRRLAHAAAKLPSGPSEVAALPLEGPTEVRSLTETFNAMARELSSTRAEEANLLASLRHDLRTPLTSIGGYAEAIADGTATGEAAVSAARTIAGEAQRLERLVAEIGVVERLRQGPAALRPERLDAAELLAAAAERYEGRAATSGIGVEVAGPLPGEPPVALTGDRLAAERILQNLIDNSLSVLPRGGHVWLRATRTTPPGRPPGVCISVTDDGPGFPPGTLDHVFERFYRADPSRAGGGSGLGLAIVRDFARAHGGEAWAENVAPHGARVTVLLPLRPVARPAPAGPSAGES